MGNIAGYDILQYHQDRFWGTEGQIWMPHLPSPSLYTRFNYMKPSMPQLTPKVFFTLQKYF